MSSPFETLADAVDQRLDGMSAPSRLLLMTAVSMAFDEAFGLMVPDPRTVQEYRARIGVCHGVLGGAVPDPLVERVDVPSDLGDCGTAVPMWICADHAYRLARGEVSEHSPGWYIVELHWWHGWSAYSGSLIREMRTKRGWSPAS